MSLPFYNHSTATHKRAQHKIPAGSASAIHPVDSSGFPKNDTVLNDVNSFYSYYRTKPISSVNNTVIQNKGIIDYAFSMPGFVTDINYELIIKNAGLAAITITPWALIDRIEWIASSGSVMSTIYGQNLYFQWFDRDLNVSKRLSGAENISTTTYAAANTLGAGLTRTFLLQIPSWIQNVKPKLNALNQRMTMRVYFTDLGCDVPADMECVSADFITNGYIFSNELAITQYRRNNTFHNRYLEWVRGASETFNMVAGGSYDIRLVSFANQLVSNLFVVIQSAPLTNANLTTFQRVDSISLLDENGTIFGLECSHEILKYLIGKDFIGDIINVKDIYPISFSIDHNASKNGDFVGSYCMSGNEQLRLKMPSTLVPGSFKVDIYGGCYQLINQERGTIASTK
jgi:hypothetical protein